MSTRMLSRLMRFLLVALVLPAAGTARAEVDLGLWADALLPPSWNTPKPSTKPKNQDLAEGEGGVTTPAKRPVRPWYVPRFALGIGANFPELLPIEAYAFFGKYFALRAFYAPPLPINIRVEMPADVISTTSGVAVANPAFEIDGKATYGAHYGIETMVFPFAGSFFFGGGVSHRRLRLVAEAKSPVLVCSLLEAAKDPPCGDPNAAIQTRTEIDVKADTTTEAELVRAALGWMWHVGSAGYFMFNVGETWPRAIHNSATVSATLETPGTADPEVTGALAQVRSQRQADAQQKALAAMSPLAAKPLPILGLGAGVRF